MPVCGKLFQMVEWILRTDSTQTSFKVLLVFPMPTHLWEAEDGKEGRCVVIGYEWVLDELHCLLLTSTCPSRSLLECSMVQPVNHTTFSTPSLAFGKIDT